MFLCLGDSAIPPKDLWDFSHSAVSLSSKMAYPQLNKSRHFKNNSHMVSSLLSPFPQKSCIVAHYKVINKEKKKKNLNDFTHLWDHIKESTNRMELTPGTTTWAYPSKLKLPFCHLDWRTSAKINFVILPKVLPKTWVKKHIFLNCYLII